MDTITEWAEVVQSSFVAFGEKLMNVLPNILGALLLLVIGWLIARLVRFVIRKVLQSIGFDKLGDQLTETSVLAKNLLTIRPSRLISKFAYWIVLLLFFISASDTLGWGVVSESISNLINYLPQLLSALIVFVIGLYIASFVKKFLKTAFDSMKLAAGHILSEVVSVIILIIIGTTALDQAGIDTTVISANITIILGAILLTFVLGIGLSAKDVFVNILSTFYAKNNLKAGDHIKIDKIEGKIIKLDSVHIILETSSGEIILPTKRLLTDTIEKRKEKDSQYMA